MVPNLEHCDRLEARATVPLDRPSGVAGEQGAEGAVAHLDDERILVDVHARREPGAVRVMHDQHHRVNLEAVSPARRMPIGAVGLDSAEKVEVRRLADRLARLPHALGIERLEHRRESAQMIQVTVRKDDRREAGDALSSQKRYDHPAASITPSSSRPAVDQNPAASGCADRGCIALTHLEKMYRQRGPAVTARHAGRQPDPRRQGSWRRQPPQTDSEGGAAPARPDRRGQQREPGDRRSNASRRDHVPPRQPCREARRRLHRGQRHPSASGERRRHRRHDRVGEEREHQARHRERGERHRHEIGHETRGRHGSEDPGSDRRREERCPQGVRER